MDKLLLPTGYLSYSAWTMWLKSKDRYIREYFEGMDKVHSKYLEFGKEAARRREGRELKEGEYTEPEITTVINGVPILAYIDYYDANTHTFREEKTGKHPWTESKVQRHEQLPFYATVLKWKYGKMPESCVLHWFETKDEEQKGGLHNQVEFTGYEKEFTREFDPREVERIENSITKVAWEISDAYTKFIQDL